MYGVLQMKSKRSSPLKADGGGLRYNDGKNRLDLNPPEWAWGLGMVTTRGSVKYKERNWERGMKWSTMVGCAARHVGKFLVGIRYDEETGCHSLYMAAWNLLALATYDIRGIGENDLPSLDMKFLNATAIAPKGEAYFPKKKKRKRKGVYRLRKVTVKSKVVRRASTLIGKKAPLIKRKKVKVPPRSVMLRTKGNSSWRSALLAR